MNNSSVVFFNDIDLLDRDNIGTEAKKLATLTGANIPIPEGFIITSTAYMQFLQENKLDRKIKQLLTTVHFEYPETLLQIANHIKKMILESDFSANVKEEISHNFQQLHTSSVSLKAYSHSKEQQLHNKQKADTIEELLVKVKDIWASHFSAALLFQRNENDISHLQTGTSIVVQRELSHAKQGKITTIDPMSHAKDKMLLFHITTHGTDRYLLSKKNLTIIDRKLKRHTLHTPALLLDEILEIAIIAKKIEKIFYFPQEISWAFEKNKFYITGTIPFTNLPEEEPIQIKKHAIARGYPVTKAVCTGYVHKILSEKDFQEAKPNDIIVVSQLSANYLPYLKKIKGIIAEKGEKHSHVTAVLRQLGIPALYDVKFAMKGLKNGTVITIHGGKGEIYNGSIL